jgi:hypothetical protein
MSIIFFISLSEFLLTGIGVLQSLENSLGALGPSLQSALILVMSYLED